jgi:hypothetical protein
VTFWPFWEGSLQGYFEPDLGIISFVFLMGWWCVFLEGNAPSRCLAA